MSLDLLATYVKARYEGKYLSCHLVVAEDVLDVLRNEWPPTPPKPWEVGVVARGAMEGFQVRVDAEAEPGSWALVAEPGVPIAQGNVGAPDGVRAAWWRRLWRRT